MTAILSPALIFQGVGFGGLPLPGGKLFSYIAGTSTPQATYTDSTQSTPNSNPVILNANGQAAVWLDPTKVYKFILQDLFGNQIYVTDQVQGSLTAAALTVLLTQSFIGAILYPQTTAEASASVVPVNFFVPSHAVSGVINVDRYETNSNPGTTSMVAGFQAAINVAKKIGGTITYGGTAPYLLDAPLDLTIPVGGTVFSFTIRGETHVGAYSINAPFRPTIILQHSGTSAFDCTGNLGLNFESMSITANAVTFPKTCFLLARNSDGRSQVVRFNNVRVIGAFSDSVIYNFGSEDDVHVGCQYINTSTGAGVKAIRFTANNVSSLSSTFTTIDAATPVSTIDHSFYGCQLETESSDASSDLVYYDSAADVRYYGCWANMTGGRAMHYCDITNGETQSVAFRDWVTESGSAQTYFADFSNNTGTISGWHFDNIVSYSSGNFIHTEGTTPILDEFYVSHILDVNNHGINIAGTLQASTVTFFQPITIGTSSGNILTGSANTWTITTRTADKWYDWDTGLIAWTPNYSALTTATAVVSNNLRIQYNGSKISFSVQVNVGTALVSAAGQQITGLPRAAAINGSEVTITNITTATGIGGAWITGTGITLPVINVGAGVTLLISGEYFAA